MFFGGFNAMLFTLGIILCALRFFGVIGISYVFATMPFWIGAALDVLIIIGFIIYNLTHKDEWN